MRIAFATSALLALLLSAPATPARAEVRIYASPGGQVGPFLDLFERVRASGERVVIDGPCLSACTLVLSTVPNDRICVTRRAILGFHAARSWTGAAACMPSRKPPKPCCKPTPRRCAAGSAATAD